LLPEMTYLPWQRAVKGFPLKEIYDTITHPWYDGITT